ADKGWRAVRAPMAVDAAPATGDVAVVNPTLYFAHATAVALGARGIRVGGTARELLSSELELPAAPRRVLAESQSPPLRDIATVMMKVSQNLYAETLLKAVGAAKSGLGSVENGRRAAAEIFAAWGIPPGGYVQADGSGLSRYAYVTAEMLDPILQRLFKDPRHKEAFTATLA